MSDFDPNGIYALNPIVKIDPKYVDKGPFADLKPGVRILEGEEALAAAKLFVLLLASHCPDCGRDYDECVCDIEVKEE